MISAGWWRLLRRPSDIANGTRWLFGVLALATIAVQTPFALAFDGGWVPVLGVGSAMVLAASWIGTYLRGRVPFWLDVVEAAAMLGFGLASRVPVTVFAILLSALWFRSLYDSRWRSVARCVLYGGVIVGTFALWTAIPGHVAIPDTGKNPGSLAVVFLTVIVGRQLGRGLVAREQSLRMNESLAAAGSRLIGLTDESAIRALAWTAAVGICAESPGLRMLRVRRVGLGLAVEASTGTFDLDEPGLPDGLLQATPTGPTVLTDPRPLNVAAGATLAWLVFDLPNQDDGWLLVGAHKAVPPDVVVALRSLFNQVLLALSNSDVHKELIAQASVDSLTGLANRATFNTALSAELDALRDGAVLHVLFVDLDDFKNVNDLLGHRGGDLLLREIGLRLRRCTRPTDLCARLGGDEFAVILRDTPEPVAMGIAQRAVEAISRPMRLGDHTARVGASVGVAAAAPGSDLEAVIHHADVAMYAAKARGKGRTQLFHTDLLTDRPVEKVFEHDLAAAAATGQLIVHYQPILTLPQLRCTAVEALVRWEHPQQGLLPAEEFVHIGEATGAIIEIGAFVLARACADTVAWQREHPGSPLCVHVNVSARQLEDDEFITLVTRHLAETGLPASQLVLELTESVVLSGPRTVARLRDLAGLGVQIGIDDFGTGYSSMTALRSLPVNVIKLDRTFVEGALNDTTDRTVLTAIVSMSQQLGLRTIAEGIERPEQQQFLEDIHAEAVQGYLYLRPVPAPELASWLTTNLRERAQPTPVLAVRGRSTNSP